MIGITQELFDKVFTEYLMEKIIQSPDASKVDIEQLTNDLRPAYLDGFKAGSYVAELLIKNQPVMPPISMN